MVENSRYPNVLEGSRMFIKVQNIFYIILKSFKMFQKILKCS